MTIMEFSLWAVYTFCLAKYFYTVGWNTAMDEVQKATQDTNSEGEQS